MLYSIETAHFRKLSPQNGQSLRMATNVRSVYEDVDTFFIASQLALQLLAMGVPQLQSTAKPANAVHSGSQDVIALFSCMQVAVN